MGQKREERSAWQIRADQERTLTALLENHGRYSPELVLAWMKPVIREIAGEHEKGRVYGRISPERILISSCLWYCFCLPETALKERGHSADHWGGWRLAAPGGEKKETKETGNQPWDALETGLNQGGAGPWSDVYGLCGVIYQAVTGQPPELAGRRVAGAELKPPSQLGISVKPEQEEALMKGLALLPGERWRNGAELYQALYGVDWNTGLQKEDGGKKKSEKNDSGHEKKTEEKRKKGKEEQGRGGQDKINKKKKAGIEKDNKKKAEEKEQAEEKKNREKPDEKRFGFGEIRTWTWRMAACFAAVMALELLVIVAGRIGGNGVLRGHSDGILWFSAADGLFGTEIRKDEVETITFLDSMSDIPIKLGMSYWDVSADRNSSVIAWAEQGRDGCDVFVAAQGGVIGNPRSAQLFSGCDNLKEIHFGGNFDTSQIEDMTNMFARCAQLTSLDLSGFDTSQVESMVNMFYGCSSLTALDVSSFDTGQVKNMAYMFEDCASLTALDVSGFNTYHVSDMDGMFRNCASLESLYISGFDASLETYISSMDFPFSLMAQAGEIRFTTENVERTANMFAGCASLTLLDVRGFDTSQVTEMDLMCAGCASLEVLDVSGFDTGQVRSMYGMFSECRSLTSLDVSHFDTGRVSNMQRMFYGCGNLTDLDISGFDMTNVTKSEEMLDGTKVQWPQQKK